jgi:hypothetical protein
MQTLRDREGLTNTAGRSPTRSGILASDCCLFDSERADGELGGGRTSGVRECGGEAECVTK